ncbi:hypothetical protein B0H19DRAFT_1156574 [Mycena capillaripes]|nr:hypothetical protein B0H19DRAFT_1156574 [Mycena capillaripes]
MSKFTIIDDRDTSEVTYTGTWVVGGTTHEHAGTVSSSVQVGNHFSVAFTGTAIGVYGTFDSSSEGVQTSYAIDGGAATTITSPSSALDSFQQLFWQSDPVTNGDHKLVVTMVAVNNVGDGEGTIWFDYFNVTTAASVGAVSPSGSGTNSTTANSATAGSGTNSAGSGTHSKGSSSATGAAPSASKSVASVTAKKSSHAGVIGGIIGALIVVAIVAAVIYQRMRKARRFSEFNIEPKMSSPPPTQPFLPNQGPMTPMSGVPGPAPVLAAAASYGKSAPPPGAYNTGGFDSRLTYGTPQQAPYGHPGQAYAPVPPQGYPAQGAYDPYAAIGASMTMQQHPQNAAPQSSYAPSVSSIPSSSQYQSRGTLSVVGGSSTADQSEFSDSIADLKRRQQQVVNSYEQGISGGSAHPAPLIQHVDSGVRALDPAAAGPAPIELPPTYTPN